MIKSLKIKNAFSFREEVTLDLGVSGYAPEKDAYQKINDADERVSRVSVVYGPNASGKSNVVKVLSALRSFICSSPTASPAHIDLVPFGHHPNNKAEPMHFAVTFSLSDEPNLYEYTLSYHDKKGVQHEELRIITSSTKSESYFSRGGESKKSTTTSKQLRLAFEGNMIRENLSAISIGAMINDPLLLKVQKYWAAMFIYIRGPYKRTMTHTFEETMKHLYKHPADREQVVGWLKSLDLGIRDMDINEIDRGPQAKEKEYWSLFSQGSEEKSFYLPHFFQSAGTISLVIYLARMLRIFRESAVAIVDEFDSSIHPLLVPGLFNLFSNRDANPSRAQLIATCHATETMNHLDKYQIHFTEKNAEGASSLYRLSEVEDVRNDENFAKNYNAGAYGAVPKTKL